MSKGSFYFLKSYQTLDRYQRIAPLSMRARKVRLILMLEKSETKKLAHEKLSAEESRGLWTLKCRVELLLNKRNRANLKKTTKWFQTLNLKAMNDKWCCLAKQNDFQIGPIYANPIRFVPGI